MTARPTAFPDWATADVVDPVSGQNNVIEPPAGWKSDGWSYQEKPPRNYDNWFKRFVGRWVRYHDEQLFQSFVTLAAVPTISVGVPTFEMLNGAGAEAGWECMGLGSLLFNVEIPRSATLTGVSVKYYNAHPSSALKPVANLYRVDLGFGVDADPPVLGSSLGDFTGGATIPKETWGVRTMGTLDLDAVSGVARFAVLFNGATTGDMIAGLKIDITGIAV